MRQTTIGRILAVTKFPRKHTPLFIAMARMIVDRMSNSSFFPQPTPPLADISAAIEALDEAEVTARSRAKGAAEDRNVKRRTLESKFELLKAYVQACANADPEHAASIIESAGMSVKRSRSYPGRTFAARRGVVSGSVNLVAPSAGPSAAYEWAYRVAGTTAWILLPVTVRATTTITGLTPGTKMEFRYRVTTTDGPGNWSEIIVFIVD